MYCFKLDQIKVATKDFHKKKLLTSTLSIDVKKIMITDRVSCNEEKD